MPIRAPHLVTVVLVSWLCAAGAAAQSDVDVRRFRPAPDNFGFLGVEGTRTPGSYRWTAAFFADWATSPLTTRDGAGREVAVVRDRVSGDFMIQLGLGGRALVGAAASWVLYQRGEQVAPSDPELVVAAFYDPRVWVKYRLIGTNADADTQQLDGPGVSLKAALDLPVGRSADYVGEGATRLEVDLNADFQLLGYGAGTMLGFRHRFSERSLFGYEMRDELLYGVALKLPLPYVHPLGALLEVRGSTDFRSNLNTVVEGDLGLRWPVSKSVTLTATVGTGFSSGYGAPDVHVITGLWWVPVRSDADSDGIEDDADACPFLPEDIDGFQDTDGCEDPDNDNDLIPDVDDLCPNDEALEDRDDDEDGCTDA